MTDTKTYPANLTLSYPEQPRNRRTVFFRPFMLIPAIILLVLLGGGGKGMTVGTVTVLPTAFMIIFRRKYPKWWFDWNLAMAGFITRVAAYACLVTDMYPSTDEDQGVQVQLTYPKADQELNRWMPLVKWFLAIPHYFLLFFLWVGVALLIVLGWFSILFTGTFSKDSVKFIESVLRWHLRVMAYAFLLITDEYPPFSLD